MPPQKELTALQQLQGSRSLLEQLDTAWCAQRSIDMRVLCPGTACLHPQHAAHTPMQHGTCRFGPQSEEVDVGGTAPASTSGGARSARLMPMRNSSSSSSAQAQAATWDLTGAAAHVCAHVAHEVLNRWPTSCCCIAHCRQL